MTLLTEEQKLEKKQRDAVLHTIVRAKSAWSFGKIKTFRDLLSVLGLNADAMKAKNYYEHELSAPVNKSFVWEFLDDLRISYDVEVFLKHNPPQPDPEYANNFSPTISSRGEQRDNFECSATEQGNIEPAFKLPPSEKEQACETFLYDFQKKAAAKILAGLLPAEYFTYPSLSTSTDFLKQFTEFKPKQAQMLLAGVGVGKTFILGAVLRRLLDISYHEGKTLSPFPYVYVTKASIVEQTKRVLRKKFGIDTTNEVIVINIEQLRSRFGEMFIKEESIWEMGVERVVFKWRRNVYPLVIIWDECQVLKNTDSIQSQIAQSYNEIQDKHTIQLFSSATPYTRVSEAKCFSVATRVPYTFGIAKDAPLTNSHWPTFAEDIAHPAEPHEHSPAAIERLTDKLEDYLVRVKNVKTQFKAKNSVKMIDFETAEEQEFYEQAYAKFLTEKAKIEGNEGLSSGEGYWAVMVKFLKYRQAAELSRAEYLARRMWQCVNGVDEDLGGFYAAVAALNFKNTIVKITRILIEKYKVPRSQISLIWGGAPKQTKTQKLKKKLDTGELSQEIIDAFMAEGVDLNELTAEVEDQPEFVADIPPEYQLGNQNAKERQKEIDKFQSGKSLYCLYTFRAGGVGLSLHHTDELTKEKVQHKESGYAVESDISEIPTRQRVNFVAPTYSAIELVQGLGRCPRINSLSDTPQFLLFYKGTVEEKVAHIVSIKLRCLGKVVKQKEAWQDVVVSGKQYIDTGSKDTEEDGELVVDNTGSDD